MKEAIKERNDLRHKAGEEGGRERWVKKCREVNETIKKEKEESWKAYVEDLDAKTNPRQVWNTIRNLDGRRALRKENEVLKIGKKGYTKDEDKAKQFSKV